MKPRPRRWFRCARCTVLRFDGDGRDAEHDDCPWFPTSPAYDVARPTDGIPVRFPPGYVDVPLARPSSPFDPRLAQRRSFLHWLMGIPEPGR